MAIELGAPKAPPSTGRATRTRTATTAKSAANAAMVASERVQARADGVQGIFQLAQFGCILTGNMADAGAVSMHSQKISIEVARVAETNASIAKTVDTIVAVGPYAALLGAVAPLVMQILVNHKRLPANGMLAGMGIVSPEMMERKARADMAEAAAEALRIQAAAEAELQALIDEQNRKTSVSGMTGTDD